MKTISEQAPERYAKSEEAKRQKRAAEPETQVRTIETRGSSQETESVAHSQGGRPDAPDEVSELLKPPYTSLPLGERAYLALERMERAEQEWKESAAVFLEFCYFHRDATTGQIAVSASGPVVPNPPATFPGVAGSEGLPE